MPEGQGNVGYDFPAKSAPNVLNAANDGLSTDAATAKIAQLGQTVGRAGNPAKLLETREIPLNGFSVLLSGITAANAALLLRQLASGVNDPQIIFQNAAAAEIGRITFIDGLSFFIGPNAGANAVAGGTNGKILIGNSAGHDLVNADTIIAIGSGAFQGTGALVQPNDIIAIGNDVLDRNGGAIGDHNVVIGNNSFSGGAAPAMGTNNLLIGSRNSSGAANSSTIGNNNILLGMQTDIGNISNSIVIGTFINGINLMSLSNVVVLGKSDQNTLIGQVVAAWSDNGNRLQVNGNGFFAGGLAPKIRTTAVLAEVFGPLDYTILADATAGAFNCNIDPTITNQREGNLKKIDASANNVTLTALSGNIFGLGAPAPSISIGVQGQSLHFQSDGTNIYIL